MSGIDDSLVEQGVKKSVAWFKKKKQPEIIRGLSPIREEEFLSSNYVSLTDMDSD